METVVILKRSIKFYFYLNYLVKNDLHKNIRVILSEIVSDDIGDIIESGTESINWDTTWINFSELEKVATGLYISPGLMKFHEVFDNEELLLDFHKYIVVEDYKKITDRMSLM